MRTNSNGTALRREPRRQSHDFCRVAPVTREHLKVPPCAMSRTLPTDPELCFSLRASARVSQDVVSLLERRGVRVMEQPLDVGAERLVRCVRPDVILIREETESAPGKWQQMASEAGRAHPAVPVILLTAGGFGGVGDRGFAPGSTGLSAAAGVGRRVVRGAGPLPGAQRTEAQAAGGRRRIPAGSHGGIERDFCHIRSYMMRAAAPIALC